MENISGKIKEAVDFLRTTTDKNYEYGIILGTGLGKLVDEIEIELTIDYEDVPYFPVSTVESHHGRLIFGTIHGKNVVAMQGRFHYYEGYSMQQITFPVRVMKYLGVHTLFVSNACGGMNPLYRRGDVMIMVDHINMLGDNPLIGANLDELGPRFPDMSEPYSFDLIELAEEVALENRIKVHKGVYVAVSGPSLETRGEYRFLRAIGADVVGMSTIPENIVANHMGMKVLGLSIITDECFPESLKPVTLPEMLEAAGVAEPRMTKIFTEVLRKLP
ncbi:MAG: purine-nucleoside phosphorylase [Ignavibacteriales bacterium]|nr:MAG: purine-nucleoside phosphorylase [Ignavibacteriaceae bacterium]MBW7874264.1 purine-nucleoside phosphorylase [Ignavibacteria bacterium]MCZ2143235.1 purine-nucleoside phosphorylase [Ignavibacteriales bacterium]OQY70662.1 MAG: purine-nucleoside phosphorylase [Ignavibacteriales bacterium UTCHB3]MBV6444115.1 Purine nucleoside phosphorylase 1 [Ignavibacteriaceae bacterium]